MWRRVKNVELRAPSFSLVVLFLWTVGKLNVCADLIAPIDIDFRGGSATSAADPPPVIARRTLGHTNCIRYSVLSFSIVFFNSPFDSPACNEIVCKDGNGMGRTNNEKKEKKNVISHWFIWKNAILSGFKAKKINSRCCLCAICAVFVW